jgi:DNA-binding SARP family transcriptional activator
VVTTVETRLATAQRVRFQLLGPLAATTADGKQISLGPAKQRGLLAVLLLNANAVVSTRQIVDDLWGVDAPPTAVKMVHVFVSRLRTLIGPSAASRLCTRGRGYLLQVEPEDLDLTQFRELAAAGRANLDARPLVAATLFGEALEHWRGAPLDDVAELPFASIAIAKLEESRLLARESRVEAELRAGRHREILDEARQLAIEQPLRERPQAHLMLASYRCGRQVEALEVLTRYRNDLAEQTGLEPGPALLELQRQILRQDEALNLVLQSVLPSADSVDRPADRPVGGVFRRRRTLAAAAAVLAVTAVLAAVTYQPWRAGSARPPSGVHVTRNAVVALDAQTGAILADVPVGTQPGPIAALDGVVWAANLGDRTISQVDTASGAVVKTYGVTAATMSLSAAPGMLWIVNGFAGTLSRILVDYQQLSAPFLPEQGAVGLLAVVPSDDNIWVSSADRDVVDLDSRSLRVLQTVRLPQPAHSIAIADGSVWTSNQQGAAVQGVPIVQGQAARQVDVGGTTQALTAGFGSIWVISSGPDRLSRIDPGSGRVVASFHLAGAPTAIAAGPDAIWVGERDSDTVQRFDPSGVVLPTELNIGQKVGGLTCDGDRIWLTTD